MKTPGLALVLLVLLGGAWVLLRSGQPDGQAVAPSPVDPVSAEEARPGAVPLERPAPRAAVEVPAAPPEEPDPEAELARLVTEILAKERPPDSASIAEQKRWALAAMVDHWDECREGDDAFADLNAAEIVAEVSVAYLLDFHGRYHDVLGGVTTVRAHDDEPPPGYRDFEIDSTSRSYRVREDEFPELTAVWDLFERIEARREEAGAEADLSEFRPDAELRGQIRMRALETLQMLGR